MINKKEKGFTLVELLAVIIILVILFVIVMPVIGNVITRSRFGAFNSSKKGIEKAAELYYFSNSKEINWSDDTAYVDVGTLKSKKYLKNSLINTLDNLKINDDTKILLYKKGNKVEYSLQLYNEIFFDWYKEQMIAGSKKSKNNLPVNVGEIKTIELSMLMEKGLTDELRLPLSLEDRCVGYVEIEKTGNNKYDYEAYVDCLTEASSFASHYVSYGGKYLDEFNDVIETSDGGYVAVGRSNSETITKYGTGNNGKYDAIIVKFKQNGEVEWSRNFGGSNDDMFNSVVEIPNGYIAVGQTTSNDGDIIDYKGGPNDALIVAHDKQGNVTYKRSYGSSGTNANEYFSKIISTGNNYIISGALMLKEDGDLINESKPGLGNSVAVLIKMDQEFNLVWRNIFGGSHFEAFHSVRETSDKGYIAVGYSSSKNNDMEGIGFLTEGHQDEALILKYDSLGNVKYKKTFRGSKLDTFYDVVETSDGYIAVGRSASSDYDMTDLSKMDNGYNDGIIVKYDKTLSNIVWKKAFGGSSDDVFLGLIKMNNNEVAVTGYSKSTDMDSGDMDISKGGYSNGILLKYNIATGNLITKKSFGGSSSEQFQKIIINKKNEIILVGKTHSSDKDLRNFNKGHSDAILVSYDLNFKLIKSFQEPVVLIEKLKVLSPNYGTNIQMKYSSIYTSNDPTIDLNGWCKTAIPYINGNTSNYYYSDCLRSFNADDNQELTDREVVQGLKMYTGEHEYKITKTPAKNNSWLLIRAHNAGYSGNMEYSNLKLKFKDGYIGHITDAINKGYIEPMVVVNSLVVSTRPAGLLPTVIDIINSNGKTGIGSYPALYVHIKPKKSEFESVYLTSSRDSGGQDGLRIEELRNFDMSITPTK